MASPLTPPTVLRAAWKHFSSAAFCEISANRFERIEMRTLKSERGSTVDQIKTKIEVSKISKGR